jgi:hypothetical protein
MNRRTMLLAGGLGVVGLAGCTPGALWHLLKGNGKQPADYPLDVKDSRHEVRVLVLSTSGPTVAQSFEFAGLDRDLASKLSRKLADETKEAKHQIKPVDQAAFDKFKASTPGWKVSHPSAIARQLGADYVIDVQVASFRVYDPETGRNMYQGVARLEVTVYAAGVEESKYQYSHECKMPDQPAYTSDVSAYRAKFLDQIVLELAARHTEHLSDPRVPPLRP